MYKFFGHFQFLNSSGCSYKAEIQAIVISGERSSSSYVICLTLKRDLKWSKILCLYIVQAIFKILGEKLTSNRKEARFTLFTIVQVPA